ncbi:MAG: class I SAM-dependent methyltransferase, partial [Lutispora sp.]|nr:class I SAM-dependent methyltransferase [Lutispora sp.]
MIVLKEKCYLCGHTTEFNINDNEVLYREAKCSYCGASVRNSDIAKIIVEKLLNIDIPLCDALEEIKRYKILGTSSTGVIHNILKHSPNYIYGEYFDNIKSGDYNNEILCIDLQDMPFKDGVFDLIISEDVIEHIFDVELAFSEINRVLKTGGYHIFTVPIHEGRKTNRRHLSTNKVFHGDPIRKEGALVYTDFGYDIENILNGFGMETEKFLLHKFYEKHEITDTDLEYSNYMKLKNNLMSFFKYNSIVFCSKKIKDNISANKRGNNMNYTGERFIPGKAFGDIEV